MSELFIVGGSDFVIGFHLTGMKNIITIKEDTEIERIFSQLTTDPKVGLIVTDKATVSGLSPIFRKKVETSVKPITVVLSEDESSSDNLREMVKKSIGVDLWKKK